MVSIFSEPHSGVGALSIRCKLLATVAFIILLSSCSYTQRPESKASDSDVGGTGDIQYTHETLSRSKRLLSVTAAPGLFETESSIDQRILSFAHRFAAKDCGGDYDFIHDPNFDQSTAKGFMKRGRTYLYQCR